MPTTTPMINNFNIFHPLSSHSQLSLPPLAKQTALGNFESLTELFRERFRNHCPLMKIPLDVFLDNIFPYLMVEDVLSLRQVNKGFNILTRESIIWRRFLERMDIPIPPLRPTYRYSRSLTDYEVERLVTQALTVDDNWRRPDPKVYKIRSTHSMSRVNELFLLPGGKYLVASVNDTLYHRFFIMVYCLDHPKGPRAMARIHSFSKAYNLEAKYVKCFAGEDGLMISYVRRRFLGSHPKRMKLTPSSHLGTEFEPDVEGGFHYQAVSVYTSLTLLEKLKDPDIVHGSKEYWEIVDTGPNESTEAPFEELAIAATPNPITQLSIFEMNGEPYLSMLNEPSELHFVNILHTDTQTTVRFTPHPAWPEAPHRIRAFRLYPGQRNMIVIRSICPTPGTEVHIIEWYDIPLNAQGALLVGVVRASARTRYSIKNRNVRKFHISDYGIPNGTKLYQDHPTLRHAQGPPPPVSIFLERKEPYGVEHHAIYAKQLVVPATPTEPEHFRYEFVHESYQMSNHICAPHRPKVLAGSTRAVIALVKGTDRSETPQMVSLRRYVHPRNTSIVYEPDPRLGSEEPEPVTRNPRRPMPRTTVFSTIESGDLVDKVNAEGGLRAIAWDEATGRIVMASEKKLRIKIVDCSRDGMPDIPDAVYMCA